jgi:formate hydrogenlyase transcriptional activator
MTQILSKNQIETPSGENNNRAQLLLEINNAVVSILDLRELLKAISPCLRRIIHHDSAALLLYDEERQELRAHALELQRLGETFTEGMYFPIEGTPAGLAFRSRQTLIVNRSQLDDFAATPLVQMLRAEGVQSGCSIPLIAHDRILGVLSLLSRSENTFTKEIAELLEEVTGQLAIAVANVLNHKQAVRERDRFAMLLEISNAVSASLGLQDILKAASTILRRHINHDFASMAIFDQDSRMFRLLALDNPPEYLEEGALLPMDGTPLGLSFKTRKAVWRERLDLSEFPSPFMKQAAEQGLQSGCSVPLISGDRVLGVLGVGSNRESSITQADAETLQHIANQIAAAVENALQFAEIEKLKNKLASEKLYLEEEIQSQYNFAEIIGHSAALKNVLRQVETVAPTDSCVLICGETGTGKELFARAIHNSSRRRERTMVKLNCAAIPTGLLESELFGHEKGAFTGAVAQRIGRFELAHKGTLLLDEIGDIPLELQPKLLRVLQENEFERLGSSRTIKVDVRLIAATNCDLQSMVNERKFRSDLYYRLNVFPVTIPPLRQRREDIPLLAGYFTLKHARRMSKSIETISKDSIAALCEYDFPGNVRELENFIERAVILTRGKELQLPLAQLKAHQPETADNFSATDDPKTLSSLEDVERRHIAAVLKQTNGVIGGKGGAAEIVGLPVSTLRHRMKKLGLR